MNRENNVDKAWVLREPLIKVMVKIGLPVGLIEAMRIVYNIVDVYWLGNYSAEALAGVSVAWPVISLVLSTFSGIYGAGVALISQYWGAREYENSLKVSGQMIFFTLTAGPVISVATITLSPYIFTLINTPVETRAPAYEYISVFSAGIPVFGLLESTLGVYMASGTPLVPLFLRSLGTVLNIVLDPLFIFGMLGLPEMGVTGAALATVLSELVAGALSLILVLRRGVRGVKMRMGYVKPDSIMLRLLVKTGLPLSGSALAEASGFTALAGIIGLAGSRALAAWSIGDRPLGVISIATAGLLTACSVVIGQSLGAGLHSKAREVAAKTLIYNMVITMLVVTPLIVFRDNMSSAFSPQDQVTASYASDFVLYMGLSLVFLSMLDTARAIASGSGHTKPIMYLSLLRLWGLRNILAYVLGPGPLGIGVKGLWIGMAISNVITGVVALAWITRYKWLKPVIKSAK